MTTGAQSFREAAFPGDELNKAFDAVWRALAQGASDRRNAIHTPTLVSNGLDGWPKTRTIVLRDADRSKAALRCHSDTRSPKVAELKADSRVGVLAYNPVAKLQIRLQGSAMIETNGPVADAAWASATLWARRCYAAPLAPGAETDGPHGNLPDNLTDRQPTEDEAEEGRSNFAVIVMTVDWIDWLYLASSGHRRGRHVRAGGTWSAAWTAP